MQSWGPSSGEVLRNSIWTPPWRPCRTTHEGIPVWHMRTGNASREGAAVSRRVGSCGGAASGRFERKLPGNREDAFPLCGIPVNIGEGYRGSGRGEEQNGEFRRFSERDQRHYGKAGSDHGHNRPGRLVFGGTPAGQRLRGARSGPPLKHLQSRTNRPRFELEVPAHRHRARELRAALRRSVRRFVGEPIAAGDSPRRDL